MNTPKHRLILISLIVPLVSVVHGQEEEAPDEVYELSPFEVSTSGDVGYLGTQSLAGTRLRTDLADVAASITVVTPELMNDTASSNLRDLLVYVAGAEVGGMGGNYTDFNLTNNNVVDDSSVGRTNTSTRIRGLAEADQARNYFLTAVPFDSYNSAAVEINRGSNAVLFGLGSPAGIINNVVQKAEFTNSGNLDLQIGRFDSYRGSLNVNQELIEDTLAIRVAAVMEDQGFEQEFAFQKAERYYVAGRFSKDFLGEDRKFGKTTIQANFEYGELTSNNPRIIPPVDLITPWFTPYTDDVLGTVNFPVKRAWDTVLGGEAGSGRYDSWNRQVITDINDVPLNNGRAVFFVVDGFRFTPGFIFQGEDHVSASDPAGSNLLGRQGNILSIVANDRPNGKNPYAGWGHASMMTITNLQTSLGQWSGTTAEPGALGYASYYFNPVVSDPSIFNYRTQSLDGPNKREFLDFDVSNISIEQLFLDDKLGFEFSWSKETVESGYDRLVGGDGRKGLQIDININLPDGTENPNFGRPFYSSYPTYNRMTEERESTRFTGFADVDFREKSGWLKWLGRHVVTGLVSHYTEDSRRIGGPLSGWDPISGIWGRENNYLNFLHRDSGRLVTSIHYLGPTLADRTAAAGSNIPQTQVNQLPMSDKLSPGGRFRVHINEPDGIVNVGGRDIYTEPGFMDVALSSVDYPVGSAFISRNVYDAQALVLQNYLLNDNIVGTVAWRKDEFDVRSQGNPGRTPFGDYDVNPTRYNPSLIPDSAALVGEEQDVTWGVVVKTPTSWLENVPVISALHFHYGESANFQPGAVRTDTRGDKIANPGGETTDYGVTLGLMDNKLSIRAVWYETNQVNVTSNGSANYLAHEVASRYAILYNTAVQGIGTAFTGVDGLNILADRNQDGVSDAVLPPPAQWLRDLQGFSINPTTGLATVEPVATFRSVNDVTSEGFELEIVYNPTPNWRILFNATRQEAVQTGLGADLTRLLTEDLLYDTNGDGTLDATVEQAYTGPFADISADQGGDPSGVDHALIWNGFWAANLAQVTQFNGNPTPELREWRWNLITNYVFTDGRLDGFNVGGSLRWEDSGPIGYALKTTETGGWASDLDKPIIGDETFNVDAWVGYRTTLMDGKIDWHIQLNVRNVLNDKDLIPIQANPNGRIATYRIPSPLTWEIRSSFKF